MLTTRAINSLRWRRGHTVRLITRSVVALGVLAALGCETYRVEYRYRPAFYREAAMGDLPDRVTLADGTVIVYEEQMPQSALKKKRDSKAEPFKIREEHPDGSVTLRALMPEDVLANTITCVRSEEYRLLWDQLLSKRTKSAYEQQDLGFEDFAAFLREHRRDLLLTLTRMLLGKPRQEVIIENLGDGVMRCRLRPHVASEFKFTRVDVVSERPGLKLLMIQ
ncbi:MAG: hypothetical protein ACYSTY_03050 [Planctomycetota bacterium]|jgi:hypothetical protein